MRSNANPVEYRTARFLVCEDGGEMKRIRNHNCAVGGCLAPSGHLSLQGRIEKKAVAKDLLLNERERERERERSPIIMEGPRLGVLMRNAARGPMRFARLPIGRKSSSKSHRQEREMVCAPL